LLPEVVAADQSGDELFAHAQLAAEFAGPGRVRHRIEQARSQLLSRFEEEGCVYVPTANRFYIGGFKLSGVASEAARFLHCAYKGSDSSEPSETAEIENVLAGFASRLLRPSAPERRHQLGASLYRDYLQGRVTKAAIRRMFLGHTRT